jgi:hypothetical protein
LVRLCEGRGGETEKAELIFLDPGQTFLGRQHLYMSITTLELSGV